MHLAQANGVLLHRMIHEQAQTHLHSPPDSPFCGEIVAVWDMVAEQRGLIGAGGRASGSSKDSRTTQNETSCGGCDGSKQNDTSAGSYIAL